MAYKQKPSYAPDAIATDKGWEIPLKGTNPADNLREVIQCIGQLPLKAGAATIESILFGAQSYEQGDALSVLVRFSEPVNADAGTKLVVSSTGDDTTEYELHALLQENVYEVLFDQVDTLDAPVLISEDDTLTFELSIPEQTIDGDIVDADAEGEDADLLVTEALSLAAGTREITV